MRLGAMKGQFKSRGRIADDKMKCGSLERGRERLTIALGESQSLASGDQSLSLA